MKQYLILSVSTVGQKKFGCEFYLCNSLGCIEYDLVCLVRFFSNVFQLSCYDLSGINTFLLCKLGILR